MNKQRRTGWLAAAVLVPLSLTACSQAAQFQPVAGAAVTTVRIATIDVLVQQGLTIEAAPVCTYEGTEFDCTGTVSGGQTVTSKAQQVTKEEVPPELVGQIPTEAAEGTDFIVLEVDVAGAPVYRGLTAAVLNENGRAQ